MKLQAYDKDLEKWYDVGRVNFDERSGGVKSVYIIFPDGYNYKVLANDVELKWFAEPGDRIVKIAPKIEMPEGFNYG